jgi:hypothetical protein
LILSSKLNVTQRDEPDQFSLPNEEDTRKI